MITVTAYHQRTKHRLDRYARGPETLDWDDQPDPFRRFEGCQVMPLTEPGRALEVTWQELVLRQAAPAPVTKETTGLLLELAFGLSAWKQYGPDRWALRCNPSSGNLHPSEVYLVNGMSDWLPQGVYHYASFDHHLERRCTFDNANLPAGVLIGLTSIHWREAWKYGERAFRYCQLDAGHALASLSYAAAALGWRIELLSAYSDPELGAITGIDRVADFVQHETETPDWLCRVDAGNSLADAGHQSTMLLEAVKNASWQGKARSLGAFHMYNWPVIEEVSQAAQNLRPAQVARCAETASTDSEPTVACKQPAAKLIRQRRSAQHFNPRAAALSLKDFRQMLSALMPGSQPPFDAWRWSAAVHCGVFVHNVEGLSPGLYCLPRSVAGETTLRSTLNPDFNWSAVADFPELYLLQAGDARRAAKTLSCHQAIAADSAFSLAMLAEFQRLVDIQPWHYRRLFWECGLIGQILYLEAEAAGMRGTGIGCFFDDAVHDVFGIQNTVLQSLYHFTVGEPMEDQRIQTLPAYAHWSNSRA